MSKGVGVPIRLLHEAAGHVCTVSGVESERERTREACSEAGVHTAAAPDHFPLSRSLSLPLPFIQVELTSGETYRGDLAETEDNWNVQLKNVTATAKVNWRGRGTATAGGRRRVFFSTRSSLSLISHSLALSSPPPPNAGRQGLPHGARLRPGRSHQVSG